MWEGRTMSGTIVETLRWREIKIKVFPSPFVREKVGMRVG
jgi:hypothetical protein